MATLYTTGLIVIVTAALKDTANQFIAEHTDAGDTTAARLLNISVPLSASGNLPATHWGSSWVAMRPLMRTHIETRRAALAAALRNQVFLFDQRTTSFDAAIASLGLQRIRVTL